MNCTGEFNAYFRCLEAEHEELQHTTREVQALLDQVMKPGAPAEVPERVVKALNDLHLQLEKHFAQEECGGYLDEAVSRVPRLSHKAQALEKQHRPLLERLRAIVDRAGVAESSEEDRKALTTEFSRFASALLNHEAGEDQILQEAFNAVIDLD